MYPHRFQGPSDSLALMLATPRQRRRPLAAYRTASGTNTKAGRTLCRLGAGYSTCSRPTNTRGFEWWPGMRLKKIEQPEPITRLQLDPKARGPCGGRHRYEADSFVGREVGDNCAPPTSGRQFSGCTIGQSCGESLPSRQSGTSVNQRFTSKLSITRMRARVSRTSSFSLAPIAFFHALDPFP